MRHSPVGFLGPFQAPYSPTKGMRAIVAGRRSAVFDPLGVMSRESLKRAEISPTRAPPSPAATTVAPWATIDSRSAFSVVAMLPAFVQLQSAFRSRFERRLFRK